MGFIEASNSLFNANTLEKLLKKVYLDCIAPFSTRSVLLIVKRFKIWRFHHEWMGKEGFLQERVSLCLETRLAKSQNTKSLTSARFLFFPSTIDGTCFSPTQRPILCVDNP